MESSVPTPPASATVAVEGFVPHTQREVETLAAFVHGVLAAFHLLGVVYNLKRKHYWDAAAHTCGVAYDAWATNKHLKRTSQG